MESTFESHNPTVAPPLTVRLHHGDITADLEAVVVPEDHRRRPPQLIRRHQLVDTGLPPNNLFILIFPLVKDPPVAWGHEAARPDGAADAMRQVASVVEGAHAVRDRGLVPPLREVPVGVVVVRELQVGGDGGPVVSGDPVRVQEELEFAAADVEGLGRDRVARSGGLREERVAIYPVYVAPRGTVHVGDGGAGEEAPRQRRHLLARGRPGGRRCRRHLAVCCGELELWMYRSGMADVNSLGASLGHGTRAGIWMTVLRTCMLDGFVTSLYSYVARSRCAHV